MRRLHALEPNSFPDLRHSIFAGEPVTVDLLAAWGSAAPNSIIDNLYGPTEATIFCTGYRWNRKLAVAGDDRIAPIGAVVGEMRARVVNANLMEVGEGEVGELVVSGPQVSPGYLDPERTAKSFVCPFEPGQVYYRTGDLVARVDGQLLYLGRLDHQIQVRGNRVELGEVEAHLRRLAKCDRAVAIGWPATPGGAADGIVGFVEVAESSVDMKELESALSASLPKYMVPSLIIAVRGFPETPHGKVDRATLEKLIEAEATKFGAPDIGNAKLSSFGADHGAEA
jgi:acyl-CoA synthetase (AMP-forming)/AMP-acid ligase II